jgi:lysine 6-dehydrogenase
MKLLVIGAGMMGSAAAYDMARSAMVEAVTLADIDKRRAKDATAKINRLAGGKKVTFAEVDAADHRAVGKLMKRHQAALSCVPYFCNYALAQAAIEAGCHFADLGGNNRVVRQELALDKKAARHGVRIAPDCGLSPGLASVLAGDLLRRIHNRNKPATDLSGISSGRADALKIYVGGLPQEPRPPFHYQLVFSVDGLINEYAEPAKILRNKKIATIEPLTEVETFKLRGFPVLEAFHTSGGTSTLPETFAGRVGECFEKTLRYPGHAAMIRALYDFGMFSTEPRQIGKVRIAPRELMAHLMVEKFAGTAPDVTIMRVEAVLGRRIDSYTLVDKFDPTMGMTSMMRTTAWPASIVTQMLVSQPQQANHGLVGDPVGRIEKFGAILQERDVPAQQVLVELAARGIKIVRRSRQVRPRPTRFA